MRQESHETPSWRDMVGTDGTDTDAAAAEDTFRRGTGAWTDTRARASLGEIPSKLAVNKDKDGGGGDDGGDALDAVPRGDGGDVVPVDRQSRYLPQFMVQGEVVSLLSTQIRSN